MDTCRWEVSRLYENWLSENANVNGSPGGELGVR